MILVERHDRTDPSPPAAVAAELEGAEQLDFPSARHPGWRVTLHRKPDRWNGFARLPRGWLHVASPLGLDCFAALRKILADAPVTGLQAALDALEHIRPCAFVAYDADSEKLHFGRSMDGFGSLYFGGESGRLLVSDSRLRVARSQGEVRLSEADREMWCIRSALSPEGSFFEGVKRCFAGVRYESAQGGRFAHRVMAPEGRPLSQEASVQFLEDGLLEAFASYGDRRVALTLSGGMDSRTLLVGMLEAMRRGILRRDQVFCVSVAFPGFDCDESQIVEEVARRAGVELIFIEAKQDRVDAAVQRGLTLDAPQFPTAFIDVLCAQEAQRRGAEILCGGFGGDEVLDWFYHDLLTLPLMGRLRRIRNIARERSTQESLHRCKTLISALLGTHALRSVHRQLASLPYRAALLGSHRYWLLLGNAENTGYELEAVAAARLGLASDAPFVRAPFFGRLSLGLPCGRSDPGWKPVARAFVRHRVPSLDAIPVRKVEFGNATQHFLASLTDKRSSGSFIGTPLQTAAPAVYRAWSAGWGG